MKNMILSILLVSSPFCLANEPSHGLDIGFTDISCVGDQEEEPVHVDFHFKLRADGSKADMTILHYAGDTERTPASSIHYSVNARARNTERVIEFLEVTARKGTLTIRDNEDGDYSSAKATLFFEGSDSIPLNCAASTVVF